MAANSGSVDLVTHSFENVPECEHGPALLFSRYDKKSQSKRCFFACAAFRDRKACAFFRWADDVKNVISPSQCSRSSLNPLWPSLQHEKMRERYKHFCELENSERSMCVNCGLLLLPGEQQKHEGQGHSVVSSITDEKLKSPSRLFVPVENNKTFAQYLFSKKTTDFIMGLLADLKITHILCVGCPRIHEAVLERDLADDTESFHSLLLDLDQRYLQVCPPTSFCRYNMLNHYFFGKEKDCTTFQNFLTGEDKKIAMVIDPPFGVMVDALFASIEKTQQEWKKSNGKAESEEMPVFWFFPYFMEQRVIGSNSKYTMLDYKVDYDNHELFCDERGRKKGSPVRIFTNLPPASVILPEDEGYWFCEKCRRYSAQENQHCAACGACPSKDGSTYKHCDKCNRCVKPSRIHCETCNICDLPQHKCGLSKGHGCHICGEMDHKRRECPNKNINSTQNSYPQKRKLGGHPKGKKKQKR